MVIHIFTVYSFTNLFPWCGCRCLGQSHCEHLGNTECRIMSTDEIKQSREILTRYVEYKDKLTNKFDAVLWLFINQSKFASHLANVNLIKGQQISI